MQNTPDLYLGAFLILSGFALSLLNLRRIVDKKAQFSSVLLSENILLTCIGIAFVSRAIYEVNIKNIDMEDMALRSAELASVMTYNKQNCDFKGLLMSYGPLIVSLVNSFLSLIIDNYMHYKMIKNVNERDEENTVREVTQDSYVRMIQVKRFYKWFQKYFQMFAVVLQWTVPLLMLIAMYPMPVKEKLLAYSDLRSPSHSCMAVLNLNNDTCSNENSYTNFTFELRKHYSSPGYIKVIENDMRNNVSDHIDSVVKNVYKIIADLNNNAVMNMNVTSPFLFRKSRIYEGCMKMCYIENNKLLLYMFVLAIVSFFVPITISTVILTKIHVMDIQKPNLKTYVSRELLYNILFWTPVMFDTFLSLVLCSYSMHGLRTSLFNVVANIYQAVKNLMNTKYFKDNSVVPI